VNFKPYAFQQYCIDRVIKDDAVGLYLDMGLGKTVITLTAINDLRLNRFLIHKCLVIAPKRVAETTWSREAKKWDHLRHLRISAVLGSKKQRLEALKNAADIYVINRENVTWLVEHYKTDWPFDMVVIDESSSFKNHKAKRFKALCWVRPHIKRIVELTGTPAPNGLLDLWAQLYLLDQGERLGKRITHYRERYFEPDQRSRDVIFSYRPKPGADEAIRKKIADICVSMKAEDYLDLPDVTEVIVPVELDSKAKALYTKMEKEMLLDFDETIIDAGSAAVLTNKLLQLCNGAVYDEQRKVTEVHQCKIEAFLELVEGLNGQPALVFYSYKHDLDRLQQALSGTGLRVCLLKGPEDEDGWNSHKIDILLAHPASCAFGLNLQEGGNQVIWFGLPWSLELYQQANKRLHRQGQKEKVIIHHLVVEGGVDEDVMKALESKSNTQEQLLEALKVRIQEIQRRVT
jgi:SNF2 family DNA or RNA helicase